jgi:hypothetical protein
LCGSGTRTSRTGDAQVFNDLSDEGQRYFREKERIYLPLNDPLCHDSV